MLDLHAFKGAKFVGTSFSQNNTKAQHFQEHDKSSPEDQGNPLQQYFGFPFLHQIDTALKNSNVMTLEISAFVRMHKLRLLRLSYVQLSGSHEEFPKKLKWLCWSGFPLESIPIDFPVECLVSLDMCYSNMKQVWNRTKVWCIFFAFLLLSFGN